MAILSRPGVTLSQTLPLCLVIATLLVLVWPHLPMAPSLAASSVAAAALALLGPPAAATAVGASDPAWHPPVASEINNLTSALHGRGTYGFIFDSSHTPDAAYGVYNWCNMPHVRAREYVRAPPAYELAYVEVLQRHHKRTPYASNAFPVEPYRWDCDDQALYAFGEPREPGVPSAARNASARTFRQGTTSPLNPFVPDGWIGSCVFPQITSGGLDDSWVHGADLYSVYHDLLGFLPGREEDWMDGRVVYRVTNNPITSQVAGMLVAGMWRTTAAVPLVVQASGVDSLEPQYPCPRGTDLFNALKSDADRRWAGHLDAAQALFARLDDISGVPPRDAGFHASFDHYYDNLSARQCHGKPLPCKLVDGVNSSTCVTQDMADTVYRLGQWEFSHMYRDAATSLRAATGNYGVWVAELAAHLRAVKEGRVGNTLYFHNVAHDGSVSRLLALLQIESMVWPGMGSELVFELYRRKQGAPPDDYFVRVLFGGQPLRSSSPALGDMDMLPLEALLAYFDGLVGKDASLVKGKCDGSMPL